MKKNKGMIVAFLTPAVIFFVVIFVYPIIRTVLMTFFRIEGVTDSMSLWTFTGIENYKTLLTTSLFRTAMMNLAKIWLFGGIIVMSMSLLFGVIITSGIRFKKFFRAVIYLPNIVSAVALATMWLQYVYSPKYGLFRNLFTALHMNKLAAIPWTDGDHKFMALLIAYCFGMIGYHMLIWTSGIERISPDLYEAATIDGATRLQKMWYISVQLIKPTIVILLVMQVGKIMSLGSDKALLLQREVTYPKSQILSTYIYNLGIGKGEFDYSAAIGLFNSGINVLLVLAANWISRKLTDTSLW